MIARYYETSVINNLISKGMTLSSAIHLIVGNIRDGSAPKVSDILDDLNNLHERIK